VLDRRKYRGRFRCGHAAGKERTLDNSGRSQAVGRNGEAVAAAYLEGEGWTILARNFRLGHKEIDLIARKRDTIAFVEVKSRSGTSFGHPLDAITRAKRREIRAVAAAWIVRHGEPGLHYRFDAISVFCEAHASRLEHLQDAWRL
jgi:putative endonuclease